MPGFTEQSIDAVSFVEAVERSSALRLQNVSAGTAVLLDDDRRRGLRCAIRALAEQSAQIVLKTFRIADNNRLIRE